MDVLLTIVCLLIVLSVLVFIHEGGHYLTAKMFGLRVTEFFLGLPGPGVSVKWRGTKFGITCILLGGYARVCGMEPGGLSPHLKEGLSVLYKQGTITDEQMAERLGISLDDAEKLLLQLCDWGCAEVDKKHKRLNTYMAADLDGYKLGEPREVKDDDKLFEKEYCQQYRSLGFIKRSVILLAGIIINILFAMLVFVILYSCFGIDIQHTDTGEIQHIVLTPWQSIQTGVMYVGAVCQAVANLFNPATAAETVNNSTSLIGIAVISKTAFEQGVWQFMQFMAMISVSLGVMNLLPIPPLDGGRFLIEIIQKIIGRNVSPKVVNTVSIIGLAAFIVFFIFMTNQDIQRFILN